jgi:hypothetical protein
MENTKEINELLVEQFNEIKKAKEQECSKLSSQLENFDYTQRTGTFSSDDLRKEKNKLQRKVDRSKQALEELELVFAHDPISILRYFHEKHIQLSSEIIENQKYNEWCRTINHQLKKRKIFSFVLIPFGIASLGACPAFVIFVRKSVEYAEYGVFGFWNGIIALALAVYSLGASIGSICFCRYTSENKSNLPKFLETERKRQQDDIPQNDNEIINEPLFTGQEYQ